MKHTLRVGIILQTVRKVAEGEKIRNESLRSIVVQQFPKFHKAMSAGEGDHVIQTADAG